jgi:dihydroorotate dehydrogenase (fumarate)
MDLSTTYLGFPLPHPFMAGASPLADNLDTVRRLEDAGAAAIVMRSLFEEQITRDELGLVHDMVVYERPTAAPLDYFPRPAEFMFRPAEYLEQVRRIKAAVKIPVIGSLNGTTPEGWLHHARNIQAAGTDALELNFYHVAADPRESSADVEARLIDIVATVRRDVTIPIAVKLSPFFSSLSHLAHQLDALRVNGLVLFNRFYQADIDPDMLCAVPGLRLGRSEDLLLRLRWLAILYGQIDASLIASGGIITALDAIKAAMAGADAIQLVSVLLTHGPAHLVVLRRELAHWLEEHDYESLREVRGSVSLLRTADPEAFERGSYMTALQTWKA